MTDAAHYRALEQMYFAAPINRIYEPTLVVAAGHSEISMEVGEKFFHAAGAMHGAVYFKMLDDAAFFAANSLESEFFLLTMSFTTYFTRPVLAGRIRSVGSVATRTGRQFIAESVIYDSHDQEAGRGNGIFVRGRQPLTELESYKRS